MNGRAKLHAVADPSPEDLETSYAATGPLPAGHPAVGGRKIGVLLVNLGTPDAPTAEAVRRYLAEFLSDERIVDYPRALWLPLLHGVILNVRPAKTAKAYAEVWRAETNESPLRFFTRDLAERLGERIAAGRSDVIVDWAMRYGSPSVASRFAALQANGCDRVVVVPLYPQYSSTTTASVHDAAFDAVKALKWQPALRIAPAFHDRPAYIEALARSLDKSMAALAWRPERVIISFHGVPERLLAEGDPYHCQCAKTARLLRERMGWNEEFAPMTFQSRFGPEKWLGPATDETIDRLAGEGVRNLMVVTPGFISDCLETLEEIGIAAAADFKAKGGRHFLCAPCLNSSDEMIALAEDLIADELSGWRAAIA
ncbi:MAG: ferrochelatase [Alphaproteobacteria bacterium]|nr:ferrochelatase [Alphaproteobacteria bacterium]